MGWGEWGSGGGGGHDGNLEITKYIYTKGISVVDFVT